ncbi:MAG: hypothetical protein FWD80_06615, partial [Propionibacteriaceae bacterium]|nr:hypothetical protein [Propionibacteriaceae bacterium]
MIVSAASIAVLAGGVFAVGFVAIVAGVWPRPPSLKAALAGVDGGSGAWVGAAVDEPSNLTLVADAGSRLERLAAHAFERWRLPLSDQTRRRLAQQGRSIGDFFAAKLTLAAAGLVAPSLMSGMAWMLGLISSPWPLGFGLVGAVLGYFWPDWGLRQTAVAWQEHSADAISVYFDLVTLIRLGNASAVQALREASELSQAPVFVQVRDALDRARLQQRPPWAELRRLSETLGLPEVGDLADIMAL